MTPSNPTPHAAFEAVRTYPIPALRLELQEYRHRATGARHLHLAADDKHNAFLVAFLTVPQDSTGVAHILEHTALCGSRRYPVRDPFFMMTRRSLSTFMNAFTASDWTAYPFASLNRKDFANLLDVYLDAAFFPALEPLDFAQEGHRVEFEPSDDPRGRLTFKGVVFNEMKGAMSSPLQRLGQALQSALFPTVTYHHNSGGDPSCIPDLTYDQLKAFHAQHYHPSNALFMTYGDIPAADHQGRFEDQVLHHFEPLAVDFAIPDERRYTAPQVFNHSYPLAEGEATAAKTHVVISWLLDPCTDPRRVMEGRLLSGVLLDNSSSPLRHALETSELGTAPSPMCGFDAGTRETAFACGLEGTEPERAEAVEQLVLDTLERVARDGVPFEAVAAVLHQLELSQREITGDGFPYGLQLIMEALTPALHGGDPAAALDQDALLEQLRKDIEDPGFIRQLVGRLLLDNPHRVRLVMTPDPALSRRQNEAEVQRLQALEGALSDADREGIVARASALAERQNQPDDPEQLPRVGLEDVAPDLDIPEGEAIAGLPLATTWYDQGTNGLVYQQLVIDLPTLDDELLDLLPLYAYCVSEVGSGGRDYLTTQARQSAVTGGLSARPGFRSATDDPQKVKGLFVVAAKGLVTHVDPLTQLLMETIDAPRFDEHGRLRELIAQLRNRREARVTGRGHLLAMIAASSELSPTGQLFHRSDGLKGLQILQALDRSLATPEGIAAFGAQLETLHGHIQRAPRRLLVVGEGKDKDPILAALARHWPATGSGHGFVPFAPPPVCAPVHQAWSTSSAVNYSAIAFPPVGSGHRDGPAHHG
ncbi:MAG: insulinase family protein [Candidatus Competibacterales bacterium]